MGDKAFIEEIKPTSNIQKNVIKDSELLLKLPETQEKKTVLSTEKMIINEPETPVEFKGLTRDELISFQNRALFFVKTGAFRKAIEQYENLLDHNKRFLTIIGMCHYWLNEIERAINVLKDAEELGFYPYRTKKFLALSYYRINDFEESRDYAEAALKISTDNELKQLLKKLGREESVMKNYKDLGLKNFLIQFSREEHDQIRSIVSDYLKEAYKYVGNELDYFPNKEFTVILYNEQNFFDVTRAPGWAGGIYDGKIRIPIRGLSGRNEMLRRVIFHEYTHALLSEITQKCPLWINEGLAEYFSEPPAEDVGQLIPLRSLEKRFPFGNPKHILLAYKISHAAITYIINKYGLYTIKELLQNFSEGKSLNSAFESVFYISYDNFVKKWGKGR